MSLYPQIKTYTKQTLLNKKDFSTKKLLNCELLFKKVNTRFQHNMYLTKIQTSVSINKKTYAKLTYFN